MEIVIKFIPSEEMRYPSCDDYWVDKNGNWQIRVSQMDDARSMLAVTIHALFEMGQVIGDRIPIEAIDHFDINYEATRKPGDESEPGDCKDAPYYEQHQIATVVEKIYCMQAGLSWKEHERVVAASTS